MSPSPNTRRSATEQSQSQDSLILHMSISDNDDSKKPNDDDDDDDDCHPSTKAAAPPNPAINDDQNQPVAAATSCHKVADLWQTVDRELRLNIGNSLKCGICLSTLTQPYRTPCVHAFCKDCINASLMYSGNKKCPECNTPITKRSLQPFDYLQDLCDAYKLTLREFGMVPAKYTPNFTTMTQQVCPSPSTNDDDDDDNEEELSPQDQLDRLDVATAWQQKALPLLASQRKIQDLQVEENAQVVDANFKACGDLLIPKAQLNSTQEVHEQAREQQLADEAWKQQQQLQEEEAKKQQGNPPQDSSVFLTAPEESSLSNSPNNNNKRVSFSTKPPTNLGVVANKTCTNQLAVHTSHASEDTEIPAEEDIITPKLTNVTFNKADTAFTVVVATPAASRKRDSTLFETSLSPIDPQASQEIMPQDPTAAVAAVSSLSEEPADEEESPVTTEPSALVPLQPNNETSAQHDDDDDDDDSKKKKKTKPKKKKVGKAKGSTAVGKETENNSAKSNAEESTNTNSTTRRSRRRSSKQEAVDPTKDTGALSMPTPSPSKQMQAPEPEPQDEILTLSHNDTEESEEIPKILEQGTQMTQDDNATACFNTTAGAMMEDSFGALHLLPVKRKRKQRQLELSQSSQVSDDVDDEDQTAKDSIEDKATDLAEQDATKELLQNDVSVDDDWTVPIKSQSPESIHTKESSPQATEPELKTKTVRKRTSFGTATTTRFGAAAAHVEETTTTTTTIPLNQEEEEEEEDRKPAARPTITPRRRRRRKSGANESNALEEAQNTDRASLAPATPAATVNPATRPRVWHVGEIVKVQPRTWPGVNKLGGVARVTKVWEAFANCCYDVAYILGGKESKVDAIFVVESDDFDDQSQPQQRRRRKADATELSMAMLQDLERQGFDTTGLKPLKTPYVKRKRPRLAPGSALKDTTNSKKKEIKKSSDTKKTTANDNKRKANSSNTEAQKTATKKVVKKAKENPKTETKTKAGKSKAATSTTAAVKAKATVSAFSSMSLPEIFVKADDHYESIMDSAQRDGELYIVTSSLKEGEMSMLKEVCSKSLGNIRLRVTDTFGKRTKICVLPVEESEGNIRPQIRTVKAVRSALAGIPMVPPDWIAQMKDQKKFIVPNTFVRSLPAKAVPGKKGGVAQYAAGIKSKQHLLLKGTSLFLCGNFPDAQRKDMHLVAKEAGAVVLKTPQQAVDQFQQSKRVVVLCNTSSIAPVPLEKQLRTSLTADSQAALVVGPGWLFDSIASVEELPPQAFPPPETKQRTAMELWRLCCADS